MTTKAAFLKLFEQKLLAAGYAWTSDATKVANFMEKVRETIAPDKYTPVDLLRGPVAAATWREIGCEGPLTYKALRALPEA